jgi:medium-chain acyl-[acyl-carrier-protein] hydrolase
MMPWIKLSKGENDYFRVFCFPYSGATAQVFRPLTQLLPEGISIYSCELPGRGRRFGEEIPGTLTEIVEETFLSIKKIIDRPYVFFGHSLGGKIGYEMARYIRTHNHPLPKHLFVTGVRAPQVPKREKNTFDLPRNEFIEKIKEMGGTPEEIINNEEMLDIMVPILRKDFQIYETYRFTPDIPMPFPITAIGGIDDKFVTKEDLEQWSIHTSSLFDMHMLAGDHFFIHDNMNKIAQLITKAISSINQH